MRRPAFLERLTATHVLLWSALFLILLRLTLAADVGAQSPGCPPNTTNIVNPRDGATISGGMVRIDITVSPAPAGWSWSVTDGPDVKIFRVGTGGMYPPEIWTYFFPKLWPPVCLV